jgi:hypothetical protein
LCEFTVMAMQASEQALEREMGVEILWTEPLLKYAEIIVS